MATSNHTISTDGRKSALTPEQKLIRLRAAFLIYERHDEAAALWYRRYAHSGSLAEWGRYNALAKRVDRARRCILRLTAPAGGVE